MKTIFFILLGLFSCRVMGQQALERRGNFSSYYEFPTAFSKIYTSVGDIVLLDFGNKTIQGYFFPTRANLNAIDTIYVTSHLELAVLYDDRRDSLDHKPFHLGESCNPFFCLEALYEVPTGRYWRSAHLKEPLHCADFEMNMRCIPLGLREVTFPNLAAKRAKDRFIQRQVMVMSITDILKIKPIFRSLEHGECTY